MAMERPSGLVLLVEQALDCSSLFAMEKALRLTRASLLVLCVSSASSMSALGKSCRIKEQLDLTLLVTESIDTDVIAVEGLDAALSDGVDSRALFSSIRRLSENKLVLVSMLEGTSEKAEHRVFESLLKHSADVILFLRPLSSGVSRQVLGQAELWTKKNHVWVSKQSLLMIRKDSDVQLVDSVSA